MLTMAQGAAGTSRFRVRPITWLILVVCLLLVVAILAALRGSNELNGRIPEVRFATDQWTVKAEPVYWDTPFDRGGEGKQYVRPLSPSQTVTVGLPGELYRASTTLFVSRQIGDAESTVDIQTYSPGQAQTLAFPAVTEEGTLREIVVSSGAITALDDNGEELPLGGEWSVQFRETPKPGRGLLDGAPAAEPLPDFVIIDVPEPEPAAPADLNTVPNPHS